MNLKGFTTQAIYIDRYDSELVRTLLLKALLPIRGLDGVLTAVGWNWPASSADDKALNELLIDKLLSDQKDDENDGRPHDGQIQGI